MNRTRLIIATIIAVPLIALGWWLGSPLLFDNEVDEAFPIAAAAAAEPADDTGEMVDEDMAADETSGDEELVDDEMADDEMADDDMADETMEEETTGPVLVSTAEVRGADAFHQGSGTAAIYRLEDGSHVLRLEDFEVTNGPDLHVLLVPNADPGPDGDISGYVDLGQLKGNVGNQNYELPPDLDPSDFGSVVIYCEPFHVIFATASLES